MIAAERSLPIPLWAFLPIMAAIAVTFLAIFWHEYIAPWLIARRRSRWDMLAASRRASYGHLHIIDNNDIYWTGDHWSDECWDWEITK